MVLVLSTSFSFFFPEKLHRCFLIPQELCCWFISILLPRIPPAAYCGATVEPMPISQTVPGLWYISNFSCGRVQPGQPAVLTGNRWTMQKFESAHQVILLYYILCNLASIFTSFSNFSNVKVMVLHCQHISPLLSSKICSNGEESIQEILLT